MKIVVLVKQAQDTEANINLKDGQVDEMSIKWIVSPYDEYAIEEAIRIREKVGSAEIIAVSLGKDRVKDALRTAYAMGVDKAVHIKVDDYNGLDSSYTASLLANFLKEESPDIILAGRQSIDSDSSQVAIQIAEKLDIASISLVTKLEVDGGNIKAKHEIEGGFMEVQSNCPILLTAQKGLNEPRYPSLKGVMIAKKKPITEKLPSDLGNPKIQIEICDFSLPPKKIEGKQITGATSSEIAKNLVHSLKEESKVI